MVKRVVIPQSEYCSKCKKTKKTQAVTEMEKQLALRVI
mgnify:CR=1 FL=1